MGRGNKLSKKKRESNIGRSRTRKMTEGKAVKRVMEEA
jgi:hypothetical protein